MLRVVSVGIGAMLLATAFEAATRAARPKEDMKRDDMFLYRELPNREYQPVSNRKTPMKRVSVRRNSENREIP